MQISRRLVVLASFALIVTACGGGTGDTTSSSSTAAPVSTDAPTDTSVSTTEGSTTTVAPGMTGTVQDVLGMMVEDPLFASGFHTMEWEGNFAWSTTSIDGSASELNRLALRDITPSPTSSRLPTDALLLDVWIQNYDGDIIPSGTAVFTPTADGWAAGSVVTSGMVFGFIETTTDYMADPVEGPVQAGFTITSWDGASGPMFEADVQVFDYFAGYELAFEGSISCTYGDPLDCELTSDDGVLRPGDEGEAVEALQEDLIALGYYTGPVDGEYGAGTETAVRLFQQDYRLGRDGRVGPNTRQTIDDLLSGTLVITMASPSGVGDVLFGVDSTTAYAELQTIFGAPDSTTGWYVDACDGHDWFLADWDSFRAIFTDRDGSRQFDGWHVSDVTDVPNWLYFKYGLGPNTTWSYLKSIGAGWEPAYSGVWYQNDIGYNNGRFFPPAPTFGDPPANSTKLKSFGTGTGAFVSC